MSGGSAAGDSGASLMSSDRDGMLDERRSSSGADALAVGDTGAPGGGVTGGGEPDEPPSSGIRGSRSVSGEQSSATVVPCLSHTAGTVDRVLARDTGDVTNDKCELDEIPCLVPLDIYARSGAELLETHSEISVLFPHGDSWAKQIKNKRDNKRVDTPGLSEETDGETKTTPVTEGDSPTQSPSEATGGETKTTSEEPIKGHVKWVNEITTMQPVAKAWVNLVIGCGKATALEARDTHKSGKGSIKPDIAVVREGAVDPDKVPSPGEVLLLIELKEYGTGYGKLTDKVKGQVHRYALSFFKDNPLACKRLSVVVNPTDLFVVFAERGTKAATFKKLFISKPQKLRDAGGKHGPGAKLLAGLLTKSADEIERQFVTNVPAEFRDTKKYKLELIGRGAEASVFLIKPQKERPRLETAPGAGESKESDLAGGDEVLKTFMGTSLIDAQRSREKTNQEVVILNHLYGEGSTTEAICAQKPILKKTFHALIMRFMGTPLRTAVRGADPLPRGDILVFALADLVDVIKKLHDFGFVHCDIRPSNILFRWIDDQLKMALIDFGGVREVNDMTSISGGDVFGVTFASDNILEVLAKGERFIKCTSTDDLVSIVRVAEAITTSRGPMPWDRDIQEHAKLMLEVYKARPITIPSLQDAMRAALNGNHEGVKENLKKYANEFRNVFAVSPIGDE